MVKVLLLSAGIVLISGAASAVTVNPDAPNGIAAIYFQQWDGGADYVRFVEVLGTDGTVWSRGIYNNSGPWAPGLSLPVPVAEVSNWTPGFFVTHDGRYHGHDSGGAGWVEVEAPPCAAEPVSGTTQTLGSVKSLYR